MMIATVFFVIIATLIAVGVSGPAARGFATANDSLLSEQSYAMAESGVQDAYYRLRNSMPVGSTDTVSFGGVTATTTISTDPSGATDIKGVGNAYGQGRTVKAIATQGTNEIFPYAADAGHGGLSFAANTAVTGSAYAMGLLSSTGAAGITGSAVAATASGPNVDQTNGGGTPAAGVSFDNTFATQDIAQSFALSSASPINEASIYVLKNGSPANATVEIVPDASGVPGTTILASGTLTASAVTTGYKWNVVTLTPNPVLDPGVPYWLVVHPSTNSSTNYYAIGASSGGYSNGVSLVGSSLAKTWNNPTPSALDYFFKIYTGGFIGTISGYLASPLTVGTLTSDYVQAHSVTNVTDAGNLFCTTGTNNNKSCIAASDPLPHAPPVSDANVASWKAAAVAAGSTVGNFIVTTAGTTIGPEKITGNLTISAKGATTIGGTIWVTGNLTISNAALVSLSSAYGSKSGVIIVDGTTTVSGASVLAGSGQAGSYLVLASDSTSAAAVSITGGSHTLVITAPYGTVSLAGAAWVRQATGYAVHLTGASKIAADPALATGIQILAGSGVGSYSLQSWGESFN